MRVITTQASGVKSSQTFCEEKVNSPNNFDFHGFGFVCPRVLHNAEFTQPLDPTLTPLALCLIHTP